jgi:hypothetical protein
LLVPFRQFKIEGALMDGVALQKKTIGGLNFKMKFSVKSNIERHLLKAERVYKVETQNICERLINELMGMFMMASAIAKQRINFVVYGF